jgi:hypothetical protein
MATKLSQTNVAPANNDEVIARRAYEIWEREGRPDGRAMEHWLQAVSELKPARESVAPKAPRSANNASPRPRESQLQRS